MTQFLAVLKSLALVAVVFALVQLGLLSRDSRAIVAQSGESLKELHGTLVEIRRSAELVGGYADAQISFLNSARNKNSIQAGIDLAATAKGTVLLINRQVIPRAMRTLDGLTASTESLNRLIASTDKSVNGDLLPETTKTIKLAGQSLETLNKSLQEASDRTISILGHIDALASDNSLAATQREILALATHADGAAANIEQSTGYIRDMLSPTKTSFWKRLLFLLIPRPTFGVQ